MSRAGRPASAPSGALVLLRDQDRSHWDHAAIAEAGALLEQARRLGRPGPYWLQAAIAACHAEAPTFEDTDWAQILALYGALVRLNPSPVVRLNRAIALEHVAGPVPAMEELDALRDRAGRLPPVLGDASGAAPPLRQAR